MTSQRASDKIEHMFDSLRGPDAVRAAGGGDAVAPSLGELQDALDALERLATLDCVGLGEAEQLDHLAVLERLKAGLAAAQARVTMAQAGAHAHPARGGRRRRSESALSGVIAPQPPKRDGSAASFFSTM